MKLAHLVAVGALVASVVAGCSSSKSSKSSDKASAGSAFSLKNNGLLPPGSTAAPDNGPGPHLNSGDGQADHWHVALGVNVCGSWQPGPIWPQFTSMRSPSRHDDPETYAGLHTHTKSDGTSDSLIHMEPAQRDEAGKRATLGQYMNFGGWHVSEDGLQLWPAADDRTIALRTGEKCGSSPAEVRWATGTYAPGRSTNVQMTEQHGDPSDLHLTDNGVVALYFVPSTTLLGTLGDVPSIENLPDAQPVKDPGFLRPRATTTTLPRS